MAAENDSVHGRAYERNPVTSCVASVTIAVRAVLHNTKIIPRNKNILIMITNKNRNIKKRIVVVVVVVVVVK